MTEHRTLSEDDAVEEIRDTLRCLPDDAARTRALLTAIEKPVASTLPIATFGDVTFPMSEL